MRIWGVHGTGRRQAVQGSLLRGFAAALAVLLFGSVMFASGGSLPALAAEGASILISKTVNEQQEARDLRPGDSVTYRVEFLSNDEDADGPAVVVDALPAAFAGWQISGLTATFNSQRNGVTLDLPGLASGASPTVPVSGTLSTNPDDLKITVGVALPVQPGAGNDASLGVPTGAQGTLEYTITVPSDLSPTDPVLRTDLTNTATFTAMSGEKLLSVSDSAVIEIDNPINIDVTPAKSWSPAGQSYLPGAESTVTIGGTQASNVNASALKLQDPADPALAPNGATQLPDGNPFNFVDFAGFNSPVDPLTNLPAGADGVDVQVYYFNGTTWNWAAWTGAISNGDIAGVRTAYTSSTHSIAPGTAVNQSFKVAQRSTHRADGTSISTGWSTTNEVRATVEAPDQEPVSDTATADFAVAPEAIDVQAQKHFKTLPGGTETTNLSGVTAGDTVGVVLRAINPEAPASTTLESLTIVEPGAGSSGKFLGTDLIFAGFDNSNLGAIWPAGATGAKVTWLHESGPTTVTVAGGAALPAAPVGVTVTGFTIEFTGAIATNTEAEVGYSLKTSADDDFVGPGATVGPLLNVVDVTGKKTDFDDATASAQASLSLVAPRIDVTIDKRVGPGSVMPGQDVIVQLDTMASTDGGLTLPTQIVVEDALSGPNTFWDAFDAKQILPPISRPVNDPDPSLGQQADLDIHLRDASGNWSPTPFVTNPGEATAINLPVGTTGVRFVYTNDSGLSQTTYVKPNLSFTARDTLRSDPTTSTSGEFETVKWHENVATAKGTGSLDDRVVTGNATDRENVGIRGSENGTGPGVGTGGMWAGKAWAHDLLTSQSEAKTWTTQYWAVTTSGYDSVHLQDPVSPSANGVGTVFETFNLTHVRPIYLSGVTNIGTVDSRLKWDSVTDVQLFNGTDWVSVIAPADGWMGANGFRGYTLTAAEQLSTLGVRLELTENRTAREAAARAGDLTAPRVGDGVSASADIRSFRLDWQLRDAARTAAGDSIKWVTGSAPFNCDGASLGCIDNIFAAIGFPETGGPDTATANDTIQVMDGATNVDLLKQVRKIDAQTGSPTGNPAAKIDLIVPNADELSAGDYPKARFTLTAKNSSTAPEGAHGAMKLAKIRVTDPMQTGAVSEIDESQFTGRSYADDVESGSNHFDTFNLIGVSYGTLPTFIDTTESQVDVWIYDGTETGSQKSFTLRQVMDSATEFTSLLPNIIGIATTFASKNPAIYGNQITVGTPLVMHLDVQMRETLRLSGDVVTGGNPLADPPTEKKVQNSAIAQGWDAVIAPGDKPRNISEADIVLLEAAIKVALDKDVRVVNGASRGDTILETAPSAPVNVTLTARSNGSTAPINTLRIEDDSESFWQRFELVSFGSLTAPSDADTSVLQVKAGGAWIHLEDFEGKNSDIKGVAVDFSRKAGNGLFPQGVTSWNASWGTAVLPFTVQLRDDVTVDWSGDSEENTASVLAKNLVYGQTSDSADDAVNFAPGVHSILVSKRAPNDASTHQVDPLVSLPWQLVFTNTGTSYLPITAVTDMLPDTLSWDGEEPTFASTPGTDGTSGLSTDPADITFDVSDDGRELGFSWPADQRMHPGESITIGLGLILSPLPTGQQAVNEVSVTTGVVLETCEQPTTFGQHPNTPASASECSNTNFVQPRAGTTVGAQKTVSGEFGDTLGENLVNGALDVRSGDECAPGGFRPFGSDYTRNPCASYTAVGATDTWKLEQINTGSNPLTRMVIVDMLPNPGDQMLAGGAARGSTFTPVLVGDTAEDIFRLTGLPAGAQVQIDVTTNQAACVGSVPGDSLWVADPGCFDAVANPANVWVAIEDYDGAIEDIAGVRFDIDMAAAPLQPAGNITVEFETVNRVVDQSATGLEATLEQYATPQFAWNQNGVIAWDTADNRVNLPSAPQRAGVTVKTAPLVISKEVAGPGAENAPESFLVDLACTVPSGVADPERVALDLGEFATVEVPNGGSATVPGLPIGANCVASESGEVGEFGETGRSIEVQPGVTPETDGLSAEVLIRERPGNDTLVNFTNTYTLGGFMVEKIVLSADEHPVAGDHLTATYEFELVCEVNGMDEPITREFTLKSGAQHEETDLPEGARCVLTETGNGDAKSTSITIAGEESDGTIRDGIVISAEGGHALVANVFDGVPPAELKSTGAPVGPLVAASLLSLLLVGAGALMVARRRGEQHAS